MYKKVSLVLSILILASFILSACGTPTPEKIIETVVVENQVEVVKTVEVEVEKTVEVEKLVTAEPVEKAIVEFPGFYPAESPWGKSWRLLGYRLEQENPECTFEYNDALQGDALTLRIKEGNPPSFGCGASAEMLGGGELWEAGLVYDMGEDMKGPAYNPDYGTWYDTFNAAAQTYMIVNGTEDSVGVIPYMQTQIIMWYNTKIYADYGLTPPTTWEEFMANCEAIKQQSGDEVKCVGGGGFNGYIGYWYDMLVFRLLGNDAMFKLYNYTEPETLNWTDPMVVKAAELLVDMIDKGYTTDGYVAGDFTAQQVAYFTGKAAHIFVGTWLMGEMKDSIPPDFQQAVMYFPTVAGYEDLTPYEATFGFLNTIGICAMGAEQEQPRNLECDVKFAKLFSDKDVQTELVQGLDYVSTIKDVPGPTNIPGISEMLSSMKLWFVYLQNLTAIPEIGAELRGKYWENVAQLAAKQLSPQEFAEKMEADWSEAFGRQ